MSESAIALPPPSNITSNNDDQNEVKQKSPSPNENTGSKSEEDECLVIDDDSESLKEVESKMEELKSNSPSNAKIEVTSKNVPTSNEPSTSTENDDKVELEKVDLPKEELSTTSDINSKPIVENLISEKLTSEPTITNVPTVNVTKPLDIVSSTSESSVKLSNSTPNLTEALNPTKKAPRPRKPNKNAGVKKAENAQQQQQMVGQMLPQNGNVVGTIQMFPYKFQQMQQPAATSSPNPQPIQPQTMSLRPLGPGYYLQTPNGTFFVQGTPPQTQVSIQNSNVPPTNTSTPSQTNKQRAAQQRKNPKDNENQQQVQIKQGNSMQSNTMMMVQQGNYRVQMTQQPPNNQTTQPQQIHQNNMVMKQMQGNGTQNQKNSPQTSMPSSTISATVSSSVPYISSAQNSGVCYMRAPTPMTFRSGQPGSFIIQPANNYSGNLVPGNLVPVSLPPNCQYQIMSLPAINVHNGTPPPTLSPNLAQAAPKSPKSGGNKKKKSSQSNNNTPSSNGSTNVTNGMFANESTKFLNNYTTNLPTLSAVNLSSSNVVEEKMTVDLNDDEPPPKIECEGHSIEMSSNDSLAQRQGANANFLYAAQRQNLFQQQKLGSQPSIKRHFIDGRTIEEEIPQPKSNSTPTKQRKVGQPPCSLPPSGRAPANSNLKDAGKAVLQNFASTLNRTQTVPSKTQTAPNKHNLPRPNPANFQPPPIVKPANYQPTPSKESPIKSTNSQSKKDLRTNLKADRNYSPKEGHSKSTIPSINGSSHQKSKLANSIEPRKSRGRPPKMAQTTQSVDSDTSMDELTTKRSQIKSSEPIISPLNDSRPRQKKNREVENLINMDFGPGKTPFQTTSADRYTENILTSRERMQSHVPSYDGRNSRASVSSNTSKTPNSTASVRRNRLSTGSNLSPPTTKRPRRDVQRNISYKHSPDFEEEEDDGNPMEMSNYQNEENGDEKLERRTPINICLFCKQLARDPNLPQYCNEECKRRFKKRQRLERMSNKCLNTSTNSNASYKSEPTPSTSSTPAPNRTSVDNFVSPPSFTIKIASPTAGGSERIRCDGTGSGFFELPGAIRSPADVANARELDGLKSMGVRNWNTSHVARWAELVCGSSEVSAKFLEQEIDGDSLLMLEEGQFKTDLGLKLGPFMKLMKDLKKIKSLD